MCVILPVRLLQHFSSLLFLPFDSGSDESGLVQGLVKLVSPILASIHELRFSIS
jgi:hypothetical protein